MTDPIEEGIPTVAHQKIAIYTRGSAAENKDNLEGKTRRLMDSCTAKGYRVSAVSKEN